MSRFYKAKKWIENREKDLAKSVIKYKLYKEGKDEVDENSLDSGAEKIVSEANRLVKNGGKEVVKQISNRVGAFVKKTKN